ncbi:MAG TPA: hypothetical protein VHW65_08020 [Gemmatimonadales bacterium]|nr:hypothetical protein [Gemmatimonadales bacterium]
MAFFRSCIFAALLAAVGLPVVLPAQDAPPEIVELHRRIGVIRDELPAITAAAEYAADLFTRDTTMRFLVPIKYDAAMRLELYWHAGGPPDTGDADDPSTHGLVILPVRSWDGNGFAVAAMVDGYQNQGRPVFVLGSKAGKPGLSVGHWLLDNGAPSGGADQADINDAANVIVMWVLYSEIVAAATRHGWEPGIYLSVLMPFAERNNNAIQFRMPAGSVPVPAIPAGQLGAAYLTSIDSLLAVETSGEHQAAVRVAADQLRAQRAAGAHLFVATCTHYLQESIHRDSVAGPFRPVDLRWDPAAKLQQYGAKPGDVLVWFSYGSYDCPNIEVAQAFSDAGLKVLPVGETAPPGNTQGTLLQRLPLAWRLPDAIVRIPFDPQWVAPSSSVDQMVNYFWLKRLVGTP